MAKKTAQKKVARGRSRASGELRVDPETALAQGNSPHGAEQDQDLPTDRDARREATRDQNSRNKYPEGKELEARRRKVEDPQAGKRTSGARKGPDAKTVDDMVPAAQPAGVTSVMDHAALNHPREEHLHRPNDPGASVEGPSPRDPRLVEDMSVLMEQIRTETKADNLYLMRRKERNSKEPREHLIDAINARLREVQGEPILDE